jgi:hypothetical protein
MRVTPGQRGILTCGGELGGFDHQGVGISIGAPDNDLGDVRVTHHHARVVAKHRVLAHVAGARRDD